MKKTPKPPGANTRITPITLKGLIAGILISILLSLSLAYAILALIQNTQIKKAVAKEVDKAVPIKVADVVPKEVEKKVAEVVPKEVAELVAKEVAEVVAEVVPKEVKKAVDLACPKKGKGDDDDEDDDEEEDEEEDEDPHPLEGRRKMIFSARPGNWRHASLSFSEGIPKIEFPLATFKPSLSNDKPESLSVWDLVGEVGRKDVYRILRHPVGDPLGVKLSDRKGFPLACLVQEKGSKTPVLWEITPSQGRSDRYKIACFVRAGDGTEGAWHTKKLSLESDHAIKIEFPIAPLALGDSDTSEWLILPEGYAPPSPPRDVTHVIIFPRKDIEEKEKKTLTGWAKDMEGHIKKDRSNVRLRLTLEDKARLDSDMGELDMAEFDFAKIAKQLNDAQDPVVGFLPTVEDETPVDSPPERSIVGDLEDQVTEAVSGPGTDPVPDSAGLPTTKTAGSGPVADPQPSSAAAPPPETNPAEDIRKLAPFPLVLPVGGGSGGIRVETIRTLLFEDKAFWVDRLEEVEDFQLKLDDKPGDPDSDGRVFHGGKFFTYVFVNLPE